MAMSEQEELYSISRVHRIKIEAEKAYDRISVVYDWLGGKFERGPAEQALGYLRITNGERVLELSWAVIS